MKKLILTFFIISLALFMGCSKETTIGSNNKTVSKSSNHSAIVSDKKNSNTDKIYKSSRELSNIVLNRINNNQQLSNSELKQMNDYIATYNPLLQNNMDKSESIIINSTISENNNLNSYINILSNKSKYTEVAKSSGLTYDSLLKSYKDMTIQDCNNCLNELKNAN